MSPSRFRAALAELERLPMMPDRPPGIETTRQGLARLKLPIDPEKVIVVAGTNGKGSTCATLEALLVGEGLRTGLYTSPHLMSYTERFRIDGEEISPAIFADAYFAVMERTRGVALSHFEIVTLMAGWIFLSGEAVPAVDRLILEVGLGGTWDSTNAFPHRWCVISKLGFDHQEFLGHTLPEIAANKFGIVPMRGSEAAQAGGLNRSADGAVVVHLPLPEEVRALAAEVRSRTGSRWVEAPVYPACVIGEGSFALRTPAGDFPIRLPGSRGAENTSLALAVFKELGFDPARAAPALARVRWPGRMERVEPVAAEFRAPCPIYLSGDHNPQGIESLLELLPAFSRRRLHLLVGVVADKDLDGILGKLATIPESALYLTEVPFRARRLADYGPWLDRAEGAWASPDEALRQVCARAQPGDMILVTGSLYLIGLVRRLMLGLIDERTSRRRARLFI